MNSTWYPEIEEPIKSREKHYSLVLCILTIHVNQFDSLITVPASEPIPESTEPWKWYPLVLMEIVLYIFLWVNALTLFGNYCLFPLQWTYKSLELGGGGVLCKSLSRGVPWVCCWHCDILSLFKNIHVWCGTLFKTGSQILGLAAEAIFDIHGHVQHSQEDSPGRPGNKYQVKGTKAQILYTLFKIGIDLWKPYPI